MYCRGSRHIVYVTSCKDLSKLSNLKSSATIFNGGDTPGGSVQTYKGLTDLMQTKRPDMLIYENVVDIEDEKEDGTTNLDIMVTKWESLGYAVQVVSCDSVAHHLR